jgi:hypothetical protein
MEHEYLSALAFAAAALLVLLGLAYVPAVSHWRRKRLEREHHRKKRRPAGRA